MEVEGWRDGLAGTRADYERKLLAEGFEPARRGGWYGPIRVVGADGSVDEPHVIGLKDDFPFSCPQVRLAQPPLELTWHIDLEGTLCLYRRSEAAGRPWQTVEGLFARVREWHTNAAAGWPDDPAEVDLGAYFEPDLTATLVTYADSAQLVGRTVEVQRQASGWFHLRPGRPPNREYRRKRSTWGYAVDVGRLEKPLSTWDDILGLISADQRAELGRLANGKDGFLVLRYERAGSEGVRQAAVALKVRTAPNRPPNLFAVETTEDTPETRRFRAGPDVEMLRHKSVAIVGCGAIGSFLAEQLARAGVGRITLVDPERLRPGNCVRHLATPTYVPDLKVDAVKAILVDRQLIDTSAVETYPETLNPRRAFSLFMANDLIVDAAADGSAKGLLEHMANTTDGLLVRVVLYRDGGIVRVERLPHLAGTPIHGEIPSLGLSGSPRREAGCGDPVAQTPPYAVTEAAALGARVAIDTLRPLRRRAMPASIVQVLSPQPDHPYQSLGIIEA